MTAAICVLFDNLKKLLVYRYFPVDKIKYSTHPNVKCKKYIWQPLRCWVVPEVVGLIQRLAVLVIVVAIFTRMVAVAAKEHRELESLVRSNKNIAAIWNFFR
jgi:hypothetical protein